MAGRKFSEYYDQLDKYTKERYEEKLNYIGPEVDDPYILPIPAVSCSEFLPDVEYPDIYNYLINTPNPVTKEELKAYKSLDGYKYLTAGWVSMYMLMLHQLMGAKSLQQLMYDILNQYHKPNLGHGLLLKDPGLSSVLIAPAWLGWGRFVRIYQPCSLQLKVILNW